MNRSIGTMLPAAVVLSLTGVFGCNLMVPVPDPETASSAETILYLEDDHGALLDAMESKNSRWVWHAEDGRQGAVELVRRADHWAWSFADSTALAEARPLRLVPEAGALWHGMTVPADRTTPGWGLPLPRRPVRSPFYADLLDLTLALTSPLEDGIVRRWALEPVPVIPSEAISGELNLGACLAEAVAVWNADQPPLLRLENTGFAQGVRFVVYPDRELHPPMYVRLLRRDVQGRPLLMHIVAGNTYRRASQARYARRALVHELAHVLQLWGHSLDPQHVLWRWGPVVDAPSRDEREALHFWRSLPEGLDLRRYDRSGEIEFPETPAPTQSPAVATNRAKARAARSILRNTGTPCDSMASTNGS